MRSARRAGAALAALAGVLLSVAAVGGTEPVAPVLIPLSGPAADRGAELSGLAWAGDTLILLPENPGRDARGDTLAVYALDGAAVRAWLDAGDRTAALAPRRVPCVAGGLAQAIRGFDGLEGLVVVGDRWYLAAEAREGVHMAAWLLAGAWQADRDVATLDLGRLASVPLGADVFNLSAEALVAFDNKLLVIGEANGARVNAHPEAAVFTTDLEPAGALPLPTLEYRITDATAADADGRFWVIDYFFPPEAVLMPPGPDAEAARFGAPEGMGPRDCIERLLELRIDADAVVRTDTPPVWLATEPGGPCRNWEGLVRLDDRGFLLVTDKHPRTLLAFVPAPDARP